MCGRRAAAVWLINTVVTTIFENKKLDGFDFASLELFPGFPRKPEMRQKQNSNVSKIVLC